MRCCSRLYNAGISDRISSANHRFCGFLLAGHHGHERRNIQKFLAFVRDDEHFSKYYDAIYVLFKTGMRISEFCGLTISDIDFNEKVINIDHQLQRERNGKYVIVDTKTEAGERKLPFNKIDDELELHLRNLVNDSIMNP